MVPSMQRKSKKCTRYNIKPYLRIASDIAQTRDVRGKCLPWGRHACYVYYLRYALTHLPDTTNAPPQINNAQNTVFGESNNIRESKPKETQLFRADIEHARGLRKHFVKRKTQAWCKINTAVIYNLLVGRASWKGRPATRKRPLWWTAFTAITTSHWPMLSLPTFLYV